MKRLVSAFCALLLLLLGTRAVDAGPIRVKMMGRAMNDYPGASWSIINGLRVVGKGGKVYATIDTIRSNVTGTPSWTITGPTGSTTAIDSAGKFVTSFSVDSTGFYYLSVSYGGQTARDTIFASTYLGVNQATFSQYPPNGCGGCHSPGTRQEQIMQTWKNTGHAQWFQMGISGQLEQIPQLKAGEYRTSCIQCHTTGWEPNRNNGNFGYVAHRTVVDTSNVTNASHKGWDSTWFAGLTTAADGSLLIPTDPTRARYNAMPAQLQALGGITCENCHGPLAGHANIGGGTGNFRQTKAITYSADLCNQCHNGSTRHTIGAYYNLSMHARQPVDQTSFGCVPCHQGASFVKWLANGKDTSNAIGGTWVNGVDNFTQIGCVACHDPHKASTLLPDGTSDPGLRQVSVDTLRNGFNFAGIGGKSQVCSYCHSARYSVRDRVQPDKPPFYGFTRGYGPHHNPQWDMFVGGDGYEYGDSRLSGIGTHKYLPDGCITCHMQDRTRLLDPATGKTNNYPQANHSMSMTDTAMGFKPTAVCGDCHGDVQDFNDVKASYDYDGNGKVEGVQTEVQGLLDKLKARLPKGADGQPLSRMTTAADSAAIRNHPEVVEALWNYYFVVEDGSLGVHNAKYAVALLQKSLGYYPTEVKTVGSQIPSDFALNQNYPNPFNPSTRIAFSLPSAQNVKLEVFDILGNLVKTLVDGQTPAGVHEVVWNGVDKNGARVASGMYIYRVTAGTFTATKKMVLMK